MAILIRQKHTEAARDGPVDGQRTADGRETVDAEDDSVVVGLPAVPNQVAVSAVVFFLTLATLSLLSGFLPVHNIAAYGPNNPASTPELIMPDWFLMWGYGFLKLVPSWLSFDLFGLHFSAEFIGGLVLPGLVFLGVAVWPFIDYHREPVHFTARPTDRPWQTAAGMAAVTFVMAASIAGMDVLVADVVGMSTDELRPYLTALVLGGPVVIGLASYAVLDGFSDDEPPGDEPTVDESPAEPTSTDGGEMTSEDGEASTDAAADDGEASTEEER